MNVVFMIHDLHKVLYRKNIKVKLLWHHDNRKIDHILQSRYASFEPCIIDQIQGQKPVLVVAKDQMPDQTSGRE